MKKARIFKSVAAMVKVYKVKDIMPDRKTAKDLAAAYAGYPDYPEKIEKFGIAAFEVI